MLINADWILLKRKGQGNPLGLALKLARIDSQSFDPITSCQVNPSYESAIQWRHASDPAATKTRSCSEETRAHLVFRDSERGSRVSVASCQELKARKWEIQDLTEFSVGMWEPTYDTKVWDKSGALHLFIQIVGQGDGGKLDDIPPQTVSILEWVPR